MRSRRGEPHRQQGKGEAGGGPLTFVRLGRKAWKGAQGPLPR